MGAIFVDDESYSSGVIRTSNKIYDKETGTTVKDDIDAIKAELNEGITMHEEQEENWFKDFKQRIDSIEISRNYGLGRSVARIGSGSIVMQGMSKIGDDDFRITRQITLSDGRITVSDPSDSKGRQISIQYNEITYQEGDKEVNVFESLESLAILLDANTEYYLGRNTYIKRIVKTINANMDVDTLIDTLAGTVADVTMLQLFANFSNNMRVFGGMFASCVYNQGTNQLYFRQKYSNQYANGITVSCVVAYIRN